MILYYNPIPDIEKPDEKMDTSSNTTAIVDNPSPWGEDQSHSAVPIVQDSFQGKYSSDTKLYPFPTPFGLLGMFM